MIERLLLGVFLLSFLTSTRARGGGKIAMGLPVKTAHSTQFLQPRN